METSQPYNNPYTSTPQPGAVGLPQPQQQNTFTPSPKPKSSIALVIVMLLVGLLVGGAAGYFIGDLLVFGPRFDESESDKAQLESRVSTLEAELAALQTDTPAPTGSTPTTTTGISTAPTANGITPDALTAGWSTYTNQENRLTFKHPSDYTVQELPLEDATNERLRVGIFAAGAAEPAGCVIVYKSSGTGGPSQRDISLFAFPAELPTTLVQVPAGAGLANDITEQAVILNGQQATELSAVEGRQQQATPGGATYTAYLIEDIFNSTYLIGGCSTLQTSPANLVGCPFETTVQIAS
ncbi:MAG: hypothetical protein Q8P33_02930 [bacterium]|nr:hypothetical protein [bacterium]